MEKFKQLVKNLNNEVVLYKELESSGLENTNNILANYTLDITPKYFWFNLNICKNPLNKYLEMGIKYGLMNEGMEKLIIRSMDICNYEMVYEKITPKIWKSLKNLGLHDYEEIEFVDKYDYSSPIVKADIVKLNRIYLPVLDINFPCNLLIYITDNLKFILDNLYLLLKCKKNEQYDKISYWDWRCTWSEIYFHNPDFINDKFYQTQILINTINLGFNICNWNFIEKMKKLNLVNECFDWFNMIFNHNLFLVPITGV